MNSTLMTNGQKQGEDMKFFQRNNFKKYPYANVVQQRFGTKIKCRRLPVPVNGEFNCSLNQITMDRSRHNSPEYRMISWLHECIHAAEFQLGELKEEERTWEENAILEIVAELGSFRLYDGNPPSSCIKGRQSRLILYWLTIDYTKHADNIRRRIDNAVRLIQHAG